MNFKNWFFLNENIASDFDTYLANLVKYAKPEEKRYLDAHPQIVSFPPKDIIIQVLKEKNLENFNWFSFSMGYWSVKRYRKEDLEISINVAKKMIDSGKLPKSEIGVKGWFKVGQEIKEKVEEYIKSTQEISNRQERKLRKSGETLEGDDKLIELVATDADLKLYFLPALGNGTEHGLPKDENEIKARKRILCSYGKGTQWCTAAPDGDYHETYLGNNIYIIHDKDKPVYQFVNCLDEGEDSHQFMDVEDNHVEELDVKYYDFLKKYANGASSCYDIRLKFDSSTFLNPLIDKDLKKNISGRNLAEIINNNSGVYRRDNFFKIASMIKDLNINFDAFNIHDFLWNINSSNINNPAIKKMVADHTGELVGSQIHDLIANSPPLAKAKSHSGNSRLDTKLDTHQMVNIIGKNNLTKMNVVHIIGIIQRSTNKTEIAKLLGPEVISKLKTGPAEIVGWIVHSDNIKETLNILGKENIKGLLPSEVDTVFRSKYLRARDSRENMEYLVKEFLDAGLVFNMGSVSAILLNENGRRSDRPSDYMFRMIKMLGKENVSKLWHDSISRMFDEIFEKKGTEGQKELAKLLKDYYLHPDNNKSMNQKHTDYRMSDYAKIENLINKHLDQVAV
jgi:hypothetical protein